MSDRLKSSPGLPSQASLPQPDSPHSVPREQIFYEEELKNARETPPHEKIIPSRFLPSNVPKIAHEVSSENRVIPPHISLKQRSGSTYTPHNQFRKIHIEESDRLYMPVSEIAGLSSELVDTEEFIAFGFHRGEDDGSTTAFDRRETFPMMVLQSSASRQGQPVPQLHSEISGTASNAALIGVGNIAGNVIKYGNNLLIQRGFGPGPYGLYALGMSIVGLFVAVFNLGLDDAMVRYVAIYRANKRAALLRGLTLFCTLLSGLAGILGAIVMLYFAPSLAVIKNAKDGAYVFPILLLMAPLIPLMSMQAVWSSGLQGFKAFKSRILLQRLLVPGSLTVLLLIVLIFFRGNILAVVVAGFISTLFSALLNLSFFSRMVTRFSGRANPRYELREWLGFALPNFLTSVIDTVLDATDTLLLAFLVVSPIALGQYAAANKISNFISMPLLTLNVTFAPTIAELFSKGEREHLDLMFQVVTKWIISFSLPLCLICMLFSQSLLSISGKGFVAAWPLLIALAAGNMMNAGTGPVGYMLIMTGHQKLSFINSMVAVVVNVLLGIFLTTRFGAVGTAIATGLALAIVNLMRLLQVHLLLHIHPYRPDTIKPILAGLISTLMIGALLYLFGLAHLSMQLFGKTLSIQLALVPVFLACYATLIILFQVSPEDKLVLDKLRNKFVRKNKKKGA
jgi:O-antigen/teichoic acid export membrane protein